MSAFKLFSYLYSTKIFSAIFHNQYYCLKRELKDCESVLDIGCGPASPIINSSHIKYSVGVEVFQPYYDEAVKNKTHTVCYNEKIENLHFEEKSFDAVVMIEVLEHLPKEYGQKILEMCHKWAKKKVIITTPNGFLPQKAIDGNQYQEHLSGWEVNEYKAMGYKVYGMAGTKFLCNEVETDTILQGSSDVFFSCIKYRPKWFFYILNAALQSIMYYFPKYSFGLFAVKLNTDQR